MDSLKTLSYPPSRHTGQRARLFPATIMSPEEVQAGMPPGQQGVADQLRGHWMLCGDVDHRMFKLLMSSKVYEVGHRASAFTSPTGSGYALFTHQVGAHQHRFVLPMWSEEVRHYLDALEHEPYGFMLGDEGERSGWVLPGVATADELAPLRELCLKQPALSDELLAESQRGVDNEPTWYTVRVMKEDKPTLDKGDFVKVTGKLKTDYYLSREGKPTGTLLIIAFEAAKIAKPASVAAEGTS
ncbi:hypothetical protein [Roseateles sp. BYS96W]|uniref:Uncharacterized protein n=1 Tax=Pelomonas nitida TaxID=3299027 RepID=A0ABW7GBY8_9BURK